MEEIFIEGFGKGLQDVYTHFDPGVARTSSFINMFFADEGFVESDKYAFFDDDDNIYDQHTGGEVEVVVDGKTSVVSPGDSITFTYRGEKIEGVVDFIIDSKDYTSFTLVGNQKVSYFVSDMSELSVSESKALSA